MRRYLPILFLAIPFTGRAAGGEAGLHVNVTGLAADTEQIMEDVFVGPIEAEERKNP